MEDFSHPLTGNNFFFDVGLSDKDKYEPFWKFSDFVKFKLFSLFMFIFFIIYILKVGTKTITSHFWKNSKQKKTCF